MAKIKPKGWARKSADERARLEAAAEAPKAPAAAATKNPISDERLAEIRADARSGRNWAAEAAEGPACACGAGWRTLTAAIALKGVHGVPTGLCYRHRGGTVQRNPQGTTYPGENGN